MKRFFPSILLTLLAVMAMASNTVLARTNDELVAIYSDAAQKLSELVLHPKGIQPASQAFNRARASQLLAQIERIRIELNLHSSSWVSTNIPEQFLAGLRDADSQLASMGIRTPAASAAGIQGSMAVLDHPAVAVLARDTAGDLAKAADGMTSRAVRLVRATAQKGLDEAVINRVLAGGIISGEPAATVRQLRDELVAVHGQTVPVIDKNGDTINFKAGDYARLVVRTKTRQAVETARNEQLSARGYDIVKIVGKVSVNFCTGFLGQAFSISGKSKDFPPLASLPHGPGFVSPPFHPNCSKSTAPFIAHLARPAELALAKGNRDAQAMLGMTPAEAQRTFKDLQVSQQVHNYAQKVQQIHGGGSKAA